MAEERVVSVSIEGNKALLRRIFDEGLSGGNLTAADQWFTPNFVHHSPGPPAPGAPPGPETFRQNTARIRAAFPDIAYTFEDLIAEEDKVVARWTARGTHQGDFRGIDPTGKQMTLSGMTIARFSGGRVAEWWFTSDQLGLLQQLGAVVSVTA